MSECSLGGLHDELPDLLHDRLDGDERARVLAHVDECAACAGELALLRRARGALLAATPRVDTDAIVSRIPGAAGVIPIGSRRRRMSAWRMAAAIALVALGGSAIVARWRDVPADDSVTVGTVATTSADSAPPATAPPASAPAAAEAPRVIARVADASMAIPGGSALGELTEADLRALLDDIDSVDPVPAAEPDAILSPSWAADEETP